MGALPLQNTPEWLDWRRNKIGASDVASILGVGFHTPYELWRIKTGFEVVEENQAMKYGKDNESMVREMLQLHYRTRIDPETCVHPDIDWAIASLDGIDAEDTIYEIKCCKREEFEDAQNGKIPEKYYPQLQWQLFVKDVSFARFVAYSNPKKEVPKFDEHIAVVEVWADDVFIEKCYQAAHDFYHNHLLPFNPPPYNENDYVPIEDEEFGKLVVGWMEADEIEKRAKKQKEEYKNQMLEFTDDSNCAGYGVKLTRVTTSTVDYEKLFDYYDIKPDDLERFKKPQIGYWRVSRAKK